MLSLLRQGLTAGETKPNFVTYLALPNLICVYNFDMKILIEIKVNIVNTVYRSLETDPYIVYFQTRRHLR